MSLNLLALKYVIEAAKTLSISKAAQNLFVSQPHLSNVIRSLEQNMDITIFSRSPKGLKLTDNGRDFVLYAEKLLREADALEEKYKKADSNSLNINISVTRSHQVMRKFSEYLQEYMDREQILVRIKETNPFAVIEDVYSGEAELGVLHYFNAQNDYIQNIYKMYGLTADPFYDREYLICMSEDNPLSNKTVIDRTDLAEQLLVLYGDYEAPSASYDVVTEFSDLFFSKRRVYVYDRGSLMDILSLCPDSYTWISGLNKHTLESHGLVLKRCKDTRTRNLGDFITASKSNPSPASRRLYELLSGIDWSEVIN